MAHLVIEQGEGRSQERVDLGDDVFTVGRGTTNDLHFPNPWLSRLHAKIIPRGKAFYLADAGSRNGTYLNGQVLTGERQLHDGDVIALGDILLRFTDMSLASRSFTLAGTETPLPAAATVLIKSQDLELHRYHEPVPGVEPGDDDGSLLPALTRAASVLINHHPLDELLELVLDLAYATVTAERGALLLGSPGGALEVRTVRGFTDGEVRISRTLIREVLEGGQAVLTVDAQSDDRFEAADSILLEGIRAIICVPLWNNRDVIGLLYLDQRVVARPFSENDLRVTGLIANLAAVKIENVRLLEEHLEKKRMEEELRLGAKIQRRLLPVTDPEVPGYEICGENRTCYEIGGDYYDYIRKRDGRLAVVVADVAGKGVGAALLMAALQASLRALIHTATAPAELAQKLNEVLLENSPDNKYATFFYAELDPEGHAVEYVNGGHTPPLLVVDGQVTPLRSTGPPVGLFEGAAFKSRRVELPPGATLLVYTDGISELEDTAGEELGVARLAEVLKEGGDLGASKLVRKIRERAEAFGKTGQGPHDDSTVVVIHRLGP